MLPSLILSRATRFPQSEEHLGGYGETEFSAPPAVPVALVAWLQRNPVTPITSNEVGAIVTQQLHRLAASGYKTVQGEQESITVHLLQQIQMHTTCR